MHNNSNTKYNDLIDVQHSTKTNIYIVINNDHCNTSSWLNTDPNRTGRSKTSLKTNQPAHNLYRLPFHQPSQGVYWYFYTFQLHDMDTSLYNKAHRLSFTSTDKVLTQFITNTAYLVCVKDLLLPQFILTGSMEIFFSLHYRLEKTPHAIVWKVICPSIASVFKSMLSVRFLTRLPPPTICNLGNIIRVEHTILNSLNFMVGVTC